MDRGDALDAAKGAIAGAVGVWLMDQVTWGMYLREAPRARRQEQKARMWGKDVAHVGRRGEDGGRDRSGAILWGAASGRSSTTPSGSCPVRSTPRSGAA